MRRAQKLHGFVQRGIYLFITGQQPYLSSSKLGPWAYLRVDVPNPRFSRWRKKTQERTGEELATTRPDAVRSDSEQTASEERSSRAEGKRPWAGGGRPAWERERARGRKTSSGLTDAAFASVPSDGSNSV